MGGAIGDSIKNWKIENDEIVTPLRRISAALKDWPIGLDKKIKSHLAEFVNEKNDNIRIPATAIRHLMAHGHFAPAGRIALTKSDVKVVETLSGNLINETERRFVSWFKAKSKQ